MSPTLCSTPNCIRCWAHYLVVPVLILPRGEILGRCLEHPRPIALLREYLRRSKGHLIYKAGTNSPLRCASQIPCTVRSPKSSMRLGDTSYHRIVIKTQTQESLGFVPYSLRAASIGWNWRGACRSSRLAALGHRTSKLCTRVHIHTAPQHVALRFSIRWGYAGF
jgi:hypothetical protein